MPPHSHATISYAEAAAIVSRYAEQLRNAHPFESVPLLHATGRVLATPIVADRAQPPFPRSTRDGFACRAADLGAGAPLRVLGLLKAGRGWEGSALASGEAVEIMTGAPLPPGADCVVMIEHVERQGDQITVDPGRSWHPGENFIPTGDEAQAGAPLVPAGTRLGAPHLAAAASMGYPQLDLYRRPRVAIVSTGDELVPLGQQPLTYQIRNSNSYSLAAQVLSLGGEPRIQPIAADTDQALEQAVRRAAAEGCDLLLLSGGVSMGKYDLVEGVLAALGARFFFTGVRMQPGKPVVFGEMADGTPWFGLPGNPVSTMVTFALFAAPVLASLGGERGYAPRFAEARLAEPVVATPGLERFLPARLMADAGAATVHPVAWQGSGDIAGTAQANCLVVVPAPEPGADRTLPPGATVRVLFL